MYFNRHFVNQVLAGAAVFLVSCAAQAQTTWHVDDDNCPGPGSGTTKDPFCSIQDAIDMANGGDDIIVAPGTYRELINFQGKNIELRSSDGPEVTIINGDLDDNGVGDGTVVSCISNETANTVLDGFTITGGRAPSGGGMLNSVGNPTVTNCIFRLNIATNISSASGGGMFNFRSSPTVTNCIFELNSAGASGDNTGGGGMGIHAGSPVVIDCTFRNNFTTGDGIGGGIRIIGGSATVINCTFSYNTSVSGGGMYIRSGSPTVTNCIFNGNTVTNFGGGMFNAGTVGPAVTNCTFSNNGAFGNGGAIFGDVGTFANCIVWANSGPGVDEIDGTPTVTFSDVLGGYPGFGNIAVNPMFVDPDNDDYHLSAGSPCIDAADNAAVPLDATDLDGDFIFDEPIPFDLDGNPRFIDDPKTPDTGCGVQTVVDMGTYESQEGTAAQPCLADLNGDGLVGILDLLALLAGWGACGSCCLADFNNDGTVGILDLLTLLANWGPCR